MADFPNSTILSRRALMASAPGGAVAALPITPANSTETDQEANLWMAKWRRLVEAEMVFTKALVLADRIEIATSNDVPTLDDAVCEANDEVKAAEEDIINSVGTSFAAIAVKLALWRHEQSENEDEFAPERSIASALRTATALAGLPDEFWVIRRDTEAA